MNQNTARCAVATLLAAVVAAPAAAQVTLTPRALGMGGAYVAAARGNETLFLNPANLGLADTPTWSVAFPQVSFGGTMVGSRVEDLRDLVKYNNSPMTRRNELLAAIPASGAEFRYDFRAPLAAIQSGRFAMGVSYGSIGEQRVGRDLVDLLFNGYESGRTDYSVGNTSGSRTTFWDFAAAYGRRIGPVSLGVTGHYIRGGTVLNSRLFEPSVSVEGREIEVDYRTVFARGGQGYGVDFGVAMQPVPSVTFSASVTNAFSQMEWSEELYTRTLTLNTGDIEDGNYMVLENRYETSEQRVDPNSTSLEVLGTAKGLYDRAYFPATVHAGAAWRGSYGTLVSVAYRNQLQEGRLGADWKSMAGVGLQQKLLFLTVRGGYASNLEDGTLISGGLSLGPLQFGAARLEQTDPSGYIRSGWLGTFGIGVRTRTELK